ncbi:MAG: HAD hydrolase-like protein [bacterium]|nr:HAD hydrolase-like protein [bacterium]
MKEIDLLIFDLDGTLIDSTQDIVNAVNHTLGALGEPPLTEEMISQYVGVGVLRLLRKCILQEHLDRADEAVSIFRRYYKSHLVDHTTLYPGIREVLDHFSGKKKAVLTNKTETFVRPILKGLGIKREISYAIGANSKGIPNPAKAPVEKILKRFRSTPERTVIVGDSPVDVQTGRLAEILTCGVTWGFHTREELTRAGPDYMIDHATELMGLFR